MDELGRVVMPKEIRRTMHLRCGEELEIFAENEGLYLRKYSALESLHSMVEMHAQVVEALVGNTVYVGDAEAVLCCAGRHAAKVTVGAPLTAAVRTAMERRQNLVMRNVTFVRSGVQYAQGMLCPLVVHGDLFGALMLGADATIDGREQGVMQAACLLLVQQLGE